MRRTSALVAWMLLTMILVPAAQASEDGDPEVYECVVPPEHDPLMRTLREIECGVGTQVWELVWYYPPVAYQAWCHLTGDCPCPHCPDLARW